MGNIRALVLMGWVLFFVGCASVNVSKEKTYATPRKDKAAVYFYRENSFQGSLINWSVWEDVATPKQIGALRNGSYFYTYLAPGEHTFFVNKDIEGASPVMLKAGRVYFFQCRLDMGAVSSKTRIAEVTENEGVRSMAPSEMVMTVPENNASSN